MNQLSWLLYIGNVLGNLGPLLFIFGLIVAIATVILTSIWYFQVDIVVDSLRDHWRFNKEEGANKAEAEALIKQVNKRLWQPYVGGFVALALWFGAALCPSSETVYAIAASQMGEKALQQPIVGKAGEALNAWLDKQIKDNK